MAGSHEDVPPGRPSMDAAGPARAIGFGFGRTSAGTHPQNFASGLGEWQPPARGAITDAGDIR